MTKYQLNNDKNINNMNLIYSNLKSKSFEQEDLPLLNSNIFEKVVNNTKHYREVVIFPIYKMHLAVIHLITKD